METIITIIISLVLLGFLIYGLAEQSTLFTFVRDDTAVLIYRGDTLSGVLLNKKGDHIERDQRGHFVVCKGDSNWLQRKTGIFFIGFPPNRVKTFDIEYSKTISSKNQASSDKDHASSDKELSSLVEVDMKKGIKYLKITIPTTYFDSNVIGPNNIGFNIMLQLEINVQDVSQIINILEGRYIARLRAVVSESLVGLLPTYEPDYLKIITTDPNVLGDKILQLLQSPKHQNDLIGKVGVIITDVIVAGIQFTDRGLRDSVEAIVKAELEAKATVAKAEGERSARIKLAEASREEQLARVADVKDLMLLVQGLSPQEQAELLAKLAMAEGIGNQRGAFVTTLNPQGNPRQGNNRKKGSN